MIPSLIGLILGIYLLPKCQGNLILIVLGLITMMSQFLYFVLSVFIKTKNLYWIPPAGQIMKVIIALSISLVVIYFFEHIVINIDYLNNLIMKTFVYLSAYFSTLKLLKTKFRNI